MLTGTGTSQNTDLHFSLPSEETQSKAIFKTQDILPGRSGAQPAPSGFIAQAPQSLSWHQTNCSYRDYLQSLPLLESVYQPLLSVNRPHGNQSKVRKKEPTFTTVEPDMVTHIFRKGAGEITQWVKQLPCQNEDLSSNPHEKPSAMVHTCNSDTGRQRQENTGSLLASYL